MRVSRVVLASFAVVLALAVQNRAAAQEDCLPSLKQDTISLDRASIVKLSLPDKSFSSPNRTEKLAFLRHMDNTNSISISPSSSRINLRHCSTSITTSLRGSFFGQRPYHATLSMPMSPVLTARTVLRSRPRSPPGPSVRIRSSSPFFGTKRTGRRKMSPWPNS